MLRTFFVRLSENRSLRAFAERSSIGQRVSHRFVAGTEIADAISVTQALNRAGMSVTVDNLGENVHNLDEALRPAAMLDVRPAVGRRGAQKGRVLLGDEGGKLGCHGVGKAGLDLAIIGVRGAVLGLGAAHGGREDDGAGGCW